MRIAILTASLRHRGGVETYIARVSSGLRSLGCDVAVVHEHAHPDSAPPIALPPDVLTLDVSALGLGRTVTRLRAWRPDILFSQGSMDVETEEALVTAAPAVLFAHDYRGMCISGTKMVRYPVMKPCERTFGPACLAHYFPRRCGGLNPATMVEMYTEAHRRLRIARGVRAVVVASGHMRDEYLRAGFPADSVHVIPLSVSAPVEPALGAGGGPARLLFVGRMESPKGGDLLIGALASAARTVGRPLHLTLAGSGTAEHGWRRLAEQVMRSEPSVCIEFAGWLSPAELDPVLAHSDLLVLPSIWPEPFGLVGTEAATRGVPTVAFDVGGIGEWLVDGVNGVLAPGRPATADGLARAIATALRDDVLPRLRAGALASAAERAERDHTTSLLGLFTSVAGEEPPARPEAVGGVAPTRVSASS